MMKFGAVEALKEEYREKAGMLWIDNLRRDTRFALRQLRRGTDAVQVSIWPGVQPEAMAKCRWVVTGPQQVLWQGAPLGPERRVKAQAAICSSVFPASSAALSQRGLGPIPDHVCPA